MSHVPTGSPKPGAWSRASPPTISICIPTHGRVDLVAEALESALIQTVPPTEVILSDDIGDSAVQELVADFADRASCPVRYVRCLTGPGQAQNVNECIAAARTDLLMLLHDDDLLMPQCLEFLIEPFLVQPDLVASYGNQLVVDSQRRPLPEFSGQVNRGHYRVAELDGLQECSFCAAIQAQFPNDGFLIRSDVAKAVRYDPGAGGATDVDFGVRCAANGKFWYVHQTTAKYRLSEESVARGAGRSRDDAAVVFARMLEGLHPAEAGCRATVAERFRSILPAAIAQAAQLGRTADGWRWYFNAGHLRRILSPGGLRRALLLLTAGLRS